MSVSWGNKRCPLGVLCSAPRDGIFHTTRYGWGCVYMMMAVLNCKRVRGLRVLNYKGWGSGIFRGMGVGG